MQGGNKNVILNGFSFCLFQDSLVAQRLKRLPGMQETRVRSLSREDPLEKEMATDREAWHPAVHGVAKSWMQLN